MWLAAGRGELPPCAESLSTGDVIHSVIKILNSHNAQIFWRLNFHFLINTAPTTLSVSIPENELKVWNTYTWLLYKPKHCHVSSVMDNFKM